MSGIIVHEWISKTGGSEKVLDVMVATFPNADIRCLWNDVPDSRYSGRTVFESWLARTPLRQMKMAALPLMPLTWRSCKPGDYDWALVSSHLFAHHVTFDNHESGFRKYVYVHTPARYIWNPELDERGTGLLPRLATPALRRLDHKRAQEAYSLAANSEYVRQRIQTAWERDSEVIYPPVDVARIQGVTRWTDELGHAGQAVLNKLPRSFVLGASRFIPYKRLDLAIRAGEAADLPVVLAGSGPEERRLRDQAAQAKVPVYFVLDPSDRLLYSLYEAASVYVFLAIEDFGIMPVEAMATGTPVVGRRVGGVSETVVDGVTGALLDDLDSPASMAAAVTTALDAETEACRAHARSFDSRNFSRALRDWMGMAIVNEREFGRESARNPRMRECPILQGSGLQASQTRPELAHGGENYGPRDA